ncbi:TadE family protein [Stappia sp.]|uniref:TadE family protein n=1 Tax=Stappia sp. TaxID=1870903 RepID=UPI003A9992A9
MLVFRFFEPATGGRELQCWEFDMTRKEDRVFLESQSGAAAVEFAIVVPVFLLIMLGILAYGIYFGAAHSVAQIAADAARASVAGLSDAERERIVRTHIAASAGSYALIDGAKVAVDAGPLPGNARQFRVVVTYHAGDLPIWQMRPMLPLPSETIQRVAIVSRGGY